MSDVVWKFCSFDREFGVWSLESVLIATIVCGSEIVFILYLGLEFGVSMDGDNRS